MLLAAHLRAFRPTSKNQAFHDQFAAIGERMDAYDSQRKEQQLRMDAVGHPRLAAISERLSPSVECDSK